MRFFRNKSVKIYNDEPWRYGCPVFALGEFEVEYLFEGFNISHGDITYNIQDAVHEVDRIIANLSEVE